MAFKRTFELIKNKFHDFTNKNLEAHPKDHDEVETREINNDKDVYSSVKSNEDATPNKRKFNFPLEERFVSQKEKLLELENPQRRDLWEIKINPDIRGRDRIEDNEAMGNKSYEIPEKVSRYDMPGNKLNIKVFTDNHGYLISGDKDPSNKEKQNSDFIAPVMKFMAIEVDGGLPYDGMDDIYGTGLFARNEDLTGCIKADFTKKNVNILDDAFVTSANIMNYRHMEPREKKEYIWQAATMKVLNDFNVFDIYAEIPPWQSSASARENVDIMNQITEKVQKEMVKAAREYPDKTTVDWVYQAVTPVAENTKLRGEVELLKSQILANAYNDRRAQAEFLLENQIGLTSPNPNAHSLKYELDYYFIATRGKEGVMRRTGLRDEKMEKMIEKMGGENYQVTNPYVPKREHMSIEAFNRIVFDFHSRFTPQSKAFYENEIKDSEIMARHYTEVSSMGNYAGIKALIEGFSDDEKAQLSEKGKQALDNIERNMGVSLTNPSHEQLEVLRSIRESIFQISKDVNVSGRMEIDAQGKEVPIKQDEDAKIILQNCHDAIKYLNQVINTHPENNSVLMQRMAISNIESLQHDAMLPPWHIYAINDFQKSLQGDKSGEQLLSSLYSYNEKTSAEERNKNLDDSPFNVQRTVDLFSNGNEAMTFTGWRNFFNEKYDDKEKGFKDTWKQLGEIKFTNDKGNEINAREYIRNAINNNMLYPEIVKDLKSKGVNVDKELLQRGYLYGVVESAINKNTIEYKRDANGQNVYENQLVRLYVKYPDGASRATQNEILEKYKACFSNPQWMIAEAAKVKQELIKEGIIEDKKSQGAYAIHGNPSNYTEKQKELVTKYDILSHVINEHFDSANSNTGNVRQSVLEELQKQTATNEVERKDIVDDALLRAYGIELTNRPIQNLKDEKLDNKSNKSDEVEREISQESVNLYNWTKSETTLIDIPKENFQNLIILARNSVNETTENSQNKENDENKENTQNKENDESTENTQNKENTQDKDNDKIKENNENENNDKKDFSSEIKLLESLGAENYRKLLITISKDDEESMTKVQKLFDVIKEDPSHAKEYASIALSPNITSNDISNEDGKDCLMAIAKDYNKALKESSNEIEKQNKIVESGKADDVGAEKTKLTELEEEHKEMLSTYKQQLIYLADGVDKHNISTCRDENGRLSFLNSDTIMDSKSLEGAFKDLPESTHGKLLDYDKAKHDNANDMVEGLIKAYVAGNSSITMAHFNAMSEETRGILMEEYVNFKLHGNGSYVVVGEVVEKLGESKDDTKYIIPDMRVLSSIPDNYDERVKNIKNAYESIINEMDNENGVLEMFRPAIVKQLQNPDSEAHTIADKLRDMYSVYAANGGEISSEHKAILEVATNLDIIAKYHGSIKEEEFAKIKEDSMNQVVDGYRNANPENFLTMSARDALEKLNANGSEWKGDTNPDLCNLFSDKVDSLYKSYSSKTNVTSINLDELKRTMNALSQEEIEQMAKEIKAPIVETLNEMKSIQTIPGGDKNLTPEEEENKIRTIENIREIVNEEMEGQIKYRVSLDDEHAKMFINALKIEQSEIMTEAEKIAAENKEKISKFEEVFNESNDENSKDKAAMIAFFVVPISNADGSPIQNNIGDNADVPNINCEITEEDFQKLVDKGLITEEQKDSAMKSYQSYIETKEAENSQQETSENQNNGKDNENENENEDEYEYEDEDEDENVQDKEDSEEHETKGKMPTFEEKDETLIITLHSHINIDGGKTMAQVIKEDFGYGDKEVPKNVVLNLNDVQFTLNNFYIGEDNKHNVTSEPEKLINLENMHLTIKNVTAANDAGNSVNFDSRMFYRDEDKDGEIEFGANVQEIKDCQELDNNEGNGPKKELLDE